MKEISLVYISRVNGKIDVEDVKQILTAAEKFNSSVGITGALFFNKRFFLQYLEGSRGQVNQLYSKILKDNRHKDCEIVRLEEIDKRLFPQWSMHFFKEESEEVLTNHDPFGLTGEEIHKLFHDRMTKNRMVS